MKMFKSKGKISTGKPGRRAKQVQLRIKTPTGGKRIEMEKHLKSLKKVRSIKPIKSGDTQQTSSMSDHSEDGLVTKPIQPNANTSSDDNIIETEKLLKYLKKSRGKSDESGSVSGKSEEGNVDRYACIVEPPARLDIENDDWCEITPLDLVIEKNPKKLDIDVKSITSLKSVTSDRNSVMSNIINQYSPKMDGAIMNAIIKKVSPKNAALKHPAAIILNEREKNATIEDECSFLHNMIKKSICRQPDQRDKNVRSKMGKSKMGKSKNSSRKVKSMQSYGSELSDDYTFDTYQSTGFKTGLMYLNKVYRKGTVCLS